jgi:hypothetical protein
MKCMHAVRWLLAALVLFASPAPAAELSKDKQFAEPRPDQALVYLIREKRFQGGGRTMFVYADQQFIGALDNNSYTFAYLPPGRHLLWLNWAKINTQVELEAGRTYYFAIWTTFDALDEASGKAFIDGVAAYSKATPKETEKSAEHIRKRYAKATASAAAKTDEQTKATNLARREAHVAKWPKVDLTAYPALCVEPFTMADPKAKDRKPQYLVESAPQRLAGLVLEEIDAKAFASVQQKADCAGEPGTAVLRARITQFKPGSDVARFMLAGAGSAQIELLVTLADAHSGAKLVELEPKGTWAWGGALGAGRGISDLEKNVAYEVATYLGHARGVALPPAE